MNKTTIIFSSNRFKLSLIFLFISACFIVNINHLSSIDENIIITPLGQINSLSEYYEARDKHKIYDIQPIRDLSHFLDVSLGKINEKVSQIGILHNLILLFIIVFVFKNVLLKFNIHPINANYFSLIFLFHPAVYEIFIEPTSRKHILASLFFLICIYVFHELKQRKTLASLIVLLTFSLSVLSHPITLFTPYFLFLYKGVKNELKTKIIILAPSILMSLYLAFLNYQYYAVKYKEMTNLSKVYGEFNFGKTLLCIGLHLKQIFMPFFFSQYYFNLHVSELAFVSIFIITVLFLFKSSRYKELHYLFPFLSVMIILYHRQVDLIFLNTYVLIPLLSILFLLANFHFNKLIKKIVILVIITTTSYRTYIRHDDTRFFKSAYKNQPNCHQLQSFVHQLALNDSTDLEELYFWGKHLLKEKCMKTNSITEYLPYVILTLVVFSNPSLSIDEKITKFKLRYGEDDLNLLQDALNIIKYQDTSDTKLNFKKYHNSILFYYLPGRIIKSFCENNNSEYCKNVNEFIERNKKNEIVLRIKK